MNNEARILAILEALTSRMDSMEQGMTSRMDSMEQSMTSRMDRIDRELAETKATVLRIENNHGQKLDALFDGYKQNADRLTRIEAEVTRHDEIIFRRAQ